VILDPSGRIIVSGSSYQGKSGSYTYANLLIRYNANGSLDASFGSKGMVVGAYGRYTYDGWGAMEILGAGANYTIGVLGGDGGASVVAHFKANGSRDTAFGPNGERPNPGGGFFQPDGKIVGFSGGDELTVSRYNGDGSIDTTFGANSSGRVTTPASAFYGGNQASVKPATLGVDASGRIVVAGQGQLANSWLDSILVRYTADGVLDTSFGNGGAAITRVGGDLGGEEQSYQAIAFQPDGKILAGGHYATSYNPNTGSMTIGMDVVRYAGDPAALTANSSTASMASVNPSQSIDSALVPLALEGVGFLDSLFPTKTGRSKRHGV
jgi:uncharacterized delta-60 repeat protein